MSDDILYKEDFKSILEAILLVQSRFETINTPLDFVSTPEGVQLFDSISMRLQIIGELLKKIHKQNSSFLDKYQQVEWQHIMKLRNIISHHYDQLDYEIIFDICENHITTLKETIQKILSDLNS
ncbi:MAG: DUF86 domain-containing protein [Cytophagales bacterium]|nr:DUF86 domain-containing protein [Cytophagales bacterium]